MSGFGTRTAYVEDFGESARSPFDSILESNDTFNHTDNYLQMGIRPGYVLQAKELTEMQTILRNQIRVLVESDPLGYGEPDANEDKLDTSDELYFRYSSEDTNGNDSTENVYNSLPIDAKRIFDLQDWSGLSGSGENFDPQNEYVKNYLEDYRRLHFGPNDFYIKRSKKGYLSFNLQSPDSHSISLFGWSPAGWTAGIERDVYRSRTDFHENYPTRVYLYGLVYETSYVFPGATGYKKYTLDNASGYVNQDAPGATRYQSKVVGFSYIPVFATNPNSTDQYSGTLKVRYGKLFRAIAPWFNAIIDGVPTNPNGPYANYQTLYESLLDRVSNYLTYGNLNYAADEPLIDNAHRAIMDLLSGNPFTWKGYDYGNILGGDAFERIDDGDYNYFAIYHYPEPKDYIKIFQKYGFRQSFKEPASGPGEARRLATDERLLLNLNKNSMIWDYRLIDPEAYPELQPTGIGNGLLNTLYSNNLYDYALGINQSTGFHSADDPPGGDIGEEDNLIRKELNPKDPIHIPYVSKSITEFFTGETKGKIQDLADQNLMTNPNLRFLPMFYTTSAYDDGQFIPSDSTDLSVGIDSRDQRFIIPIQKIPTCESHAEECDMSLYDLHNDRDRYLGTNNLISNGLYLIQNDSDGWN